jgi:hypothetical protein
MADGPQLWLNSRADGPGTDPVEAFEAAMYSDATLVGLAESGPLVLMPAFPPFTEGVRMSAVARVGWSLNADVDLSKSDTDSYHGGGALEEIASLISLALGVRCRSGGITRRWLRDGGDPLGVPMEWDHRRPYLPRRQGARAILPNLAAEGDLREAMQLINSMNLASGAAATALIRAARQYQHAVWVAEDDPNLCWLELVSALEIAALEVNQDLPPAQRLERAKPDLWINLLSLGIEAATEIAEQLADQVRSTARFMQFCDQYLPQPPEQRPSLGAQVDWSRMRKHLELIYGYRSKALHAGKPFPQPMCDSPYPDEGGVAMEVPLGLATGTAGAVWLAKETPMHLHVFADIVRRSLLAWWAAVCARPAGLEDDALRAAADVTNTIESETAHGVSEKRTGEIGARRWTARLRVAVNRKVSRKRRAAPPAR